jgi:hypothetical protein
MRILDLLLWLRDICVSFFPANEIIQKGNDEAKKIVVISEAEKEKEVQASYATALKGLFSTLNVTQEDHKLSLMLVRAMEDSVDNLYSGYGFEKNTLYTPWYTLYSVHSMIFCTPH